MVAAAAEDDDDAVEAAVTGPLELVFGMGGNADCTDRLGGAGQLTTQEESNCRFCDFSRQRCLILAANSCWNSVSRSAGGGDLALSALSGSNWFTPDGALTTALVITTDAADAGALLLAVAVVVATATAGDGATAGAGRSSVTTSGGRNDDRVERQRVSGDGRGNSDAPTGVKTTPSKISDMNPTVLLGPLPPPVESALESRSVSDETLCGWLLLPLLWNGNALLCLRLSEDSSISACQIKSKTRGEHQAMS